MHCESLLTPLVKEELDARTLPNTLHALQNVLRVVTPYPLDAVLYDV